MNNIKFETHQNGEIFEYHFYPKADELIISAEECFSNNERLWKDWCMQEGPSKSFEKFNISNTITGENIFLYMLLIWELCQGKNLLGTGIGETDIIQQSLDINPDLVNWEYILEHEFVIKNNYTRRIIGFKNAKSPVIKQYYKPINKTPLDKTGLFNLNSFSKLTDLLKPGFSDASILSNFYITDNPNLIIEKLKTDRKPDFKNLLNTQDIFVGLLIGTDLGHYDYILISSKTDLTERLDLITNKIYEFAREYIISIPTLKTADEMIELIENGLNKARFRTLL